MMLQLQPRRISEHPARFDVDLAALAAQAAIALDNLALQRKTDLTPVKTLADSIAVGLQSQATIDPTTAVAVQRALIDSPNAQRNTTVNELLLNATELVQRLLRVAAEGSSSGEDIKWLRTVCVALSRSATALAGSLYDRASPPLAY